jgi:histidyl-tRNA synthetase
MDPAGRAPKSQLKPADTVGARYVVLMGEAELAKGAWTVRDMASSTQEEASEAEAAERLAAHFERKTDG